MQSLQKARRYKEGTDLNRRFLALPTMQIGSKLLFDFLHTLTNIAGSFSYYDPERSLQEWDFIVW